MLEIRKRTNEDIFAYVQNYLYLCAKIGSERKIQHMNQVTEKETMKGNKERLLTLDEMYELLMSDSYKECVDLYKLKLKRLSNGRVRLKELQNFGLKLEKFPLLVRHIMAEELLYMPVEAIEEKHFRRLSADYCIAYTLWMHPLKWVNPMEVGDVVSERKIAREEYDRSRMDLITRRKRELKRRLLCIMSDNPRISTVDNIRTGDISGIHYWRYLTRDIFSLERKIDSGQYITKGEILQSKEYDAVSLRENILIIAEMRGGRRAAELLRMLQREWPIMKCWKRKMEYMSKEEIDEFEDVLMHGLDDLLSKWESESSEEENAVSTSFLLLTEECINSGKEKQVISEIRSACKGTAPLLWKVLNTNEALGYLAIGQLDAAKIYRAICDYFGQLPYTDRNFRDARNK